MANGMNRPGTIVNWIDQSVRANVIEDTVVRPLYLQLFTSDKGPESLHTIHGNDFFKLYGNNPSFKKHGQPLLQAAEIIKAGGEVLCKRVVHLQTLSSLLKFLMNQYRKLMVLVKLYILMQTQVKKLQTLLVV